MNTPRAVIAIFGLLFMVSCNSSKVMVYDDSANFEPTESVEILITPPETPFTVITRLDISGTLSVKSGVPELLEKLRDRAKALGADAIIPTIEGLESFKAETTYNPWVTTSGTTRNPMNVISANAIRFDSVGTNPMAPDSVDTDSLMAEPYEEEEPIVLRKAPRESRVVVGLQVNGLPFALNGYGGSAWIGEDRFRASASYIQTDIPRQVLSGTSFEGTINYAARADIDYFFTGMLSGPYVGIGVQYGNYTYEHTYLSGSATQEKVEYSLSLGYKLNLMRNLNIDLRAAGNGLIYGADPIVVGNTVYDAYFAEPFASVALGFQF